MSVGVLVICEDPTHNGYILKPLVEMVLAVAGKPTSNVQMLTKPRLTGYDAAVRAIRDDLAARWRYMDLWLFFPDADRASRAAMDNLEGSLASQGVDLLCCPAKPEVEVYACVAYRDELDLPWNDVRTHPQMKEAIFAPLLRKHGDQRRPGGGRKFMTERSIANRNRFFRSCPEVARLRDRIRERVS